VQPISWELWWQIVLLLGVIGFIILVIKEN
jgi:hypothetical protein